MGPRRNPGPYFCEGTITDLVLQFPGFVLFGVGMRWIWNPSIKPTRDDHKTRGDHKVYLVVDGFGHNGRIFRERDVETTVTDLMFRTIRRTSSRCCGQSRRTSARAGDFAPCRSRRARATIIDTGVRRQPLWSGSSTDPATELQLTLRMN
jgi:hypothetical protein